MICADRATRAMILVTRNARDVKGTGAAVADPWGG